MHKILLTKNETIVDCVHLEEGDFETGGSETNQTIIEQPSKTGVDSDDKILILVLHVDDEKGFLDSSKQILEMKAPVHVYAASSVEEAKEILKTKKVDVIVSDYQMPAENGLEFLRELRETQNSVPFILFTGRGREEVAIEALNLGADGYFNKFGKPETVYGQLMHAIFSCVKAKHVENDLLKFKTISDRAGYGVLLINMDGMVLYANESLAKMHGYAVKEMVGNNHSIIHTKDGYLRVESSKQELFDKGYLVMEEKHLKKDGSLIPVLNNVTLIRDPKGTPSFVAVIVRDITERKRAEKALRLSEKKFRRFFEKLLTTCI